MYINKDDFIKVYEVHFLNYHTYDQDQVYCKETSDTIKLPETYATMLVPEYELEKFRKFGNGYAMTKFVGYMIDPRKQITVINGDFVSQGERVFFSKDKEEEE